MRLEQALKEEAARQGFFLAGITTPGPPEHLAVFEQWLQAGLHGEMTYLESERSRLCRADPRQILPECEAILVVGMPYFPAKQGIGEMGKGRVAAYAWGEDYHDVIPERMRALVGFLEAQLGRPVPNRWYSDSGPLLERNLAQRAGLGWVGKNTCLINPQWGSYFFLAELLLGVPLEPDIPLREDHCGSCRRCIEACPTGCIRPDRTLDARRCISYLTIELKGEIPEDLRHLLGDWIFGCDACQQVCPWNRFAPEQGDPAFAPRPDVPEPELVVELALTAEEFRWEFKGSPVLRAKRRGYLRNVAVALGNQGDARAIPALERAMTEDPERLVRMHAEWALRQIEIGSDR
jgi:epoxyqueuosine reductase